MEISGKVIQMLPLASGTGKNGEWKKQEFVLEIPGQYPRKVCIALWGDRISEFDVKEGEVLKAFIDVESREFNGRWYTDVKAWKIEREENSGAGIDQIPPDEVYPDDDLPF